MPMTNGSQPADDKVVGDSRDDDDDDAGEAQSFIISQGPQHDLTDRVAAIFPQRDILRCVRIFPTFTKR